MGGFSNKLEANSNSVPKLKFAVKVFASVSILAFCVIALLTTAFQFIISRDMRFSAETNNLTLSREAALSTSQIISSTISGVQFLLESAATNQAMFGINTITAQEEFFFRNNPNILAIKTENIIIINRSFFLAYDIKDDDAAKFFNMHKDKAGQAAYGIINIINASPVLQTPAIGIFFRPLRGGGYISALLSVGAFSSVYTPGANNSIMINDSGDLLASSDAALLLAGENLFQQNFIRYVLESGDMSMQRRYEDSNRNVHFGAFQKISEYNVYVITSVEEKIALESLRVTSRAIIYCALILLIISLVFVWFWTRMVARPIERLSLFAKRLTSGDYAAEPPVRIADERGALSENLAELRTRLAERDRLVAIFAKFSNSALVQKALRGRITPGGKEMDVTVMAVRLFSWITLSQELECQAAAQIGNAFLALVFECVQENEGTIVNFASGTVLAVWGAPEKSGDKKKAARKAVNAALQLQNALSAYNATHRPPFICGCGIDSGKAFCGQSGTKDRMEWQVSGMAVENAFFTGHECIRQGTNLLVSDAAKKLCGKEFVFERKPVVTVKGKRTSLETFAVISKGAETAVGNAESGGQNE